MIQKIFEGVLVSGLQTLGYTLKRGHAYRDPISLMVLKANEFKIDTILDIGANKGQYATELRVKGWSGGIVSFEPLTEAHAALSAAAKGRWEVADRMALGSSDEETTINVSENSSSSSIMNVKDRSVETAPGSAFAFKEQIKIYKLDSICEDRWGGRLGMKIDTQGYEAQVLAGAADTFSKVHVVTIEMSLAELYQGGPTPQSLFSFMANQGFKCISIVEGFSDPRRNEMLQVDSTFVRL